MKINNKHANNEKIVNKDILFIVGPTAVGKTDIAIEIAQRFDTEIISADSMQIYRGFEIGSAKPTQSERERAAHHLIDICDPKEKFSVMQYQKLALDKIEEFREDWKLPIVCGGTGLYINSLIYNMDFSDVPENPQLRKELEEEAVKYGNEQVHMRLEALNPELALKIHPNRLKRVIRAIEVLNNKEDGIQDFENSKVRNENINPIVVFLTRDREELYGRIEARVDVLIRRGLIDEVRSLLGDGLTRDDISYKGIGYKEIGDYLQGDYDESRAIELLKRNTRRYAKRQITWFKAYDFAHVINLSCVSNECACEEISAIIRKSRFDDE
ncbi:MAG: tRNA (adenosine(37)-N6)-dimethylallyltransferase MiaA [Clostridiales Family XIII bacterium]|jgi:tRNA dimethylallyltransferase|nr:tRNA (adenosine(37)-N6)-dimethylallyltransferase MiaA [Clostridiales Family XIII bacterium]